MYKTIKEIKNEINSISRTIKIEIDFKCDNNGFWYIAHNDKKIGYIYYNSLHKMCVFKYSLDDEVFLYRQTELYRMLELHLQWINKKANPLDDYNLFIKENFDSGDDEFTEEELVQNGLTFCFRDTANADENDYERIQNNYNEI